MAIGESDKENVSSQPDAVVQSAVATKPAVAVATTATASVATASAATATTSTTATTTTQDGNEKRKR